MMSARTSIFLIVPAAAAVSAALGVQWLSEQGAGFGGHFTGAEVCTLLPEADEAAAAGLHAARRAPAGAAPAGMVWVPGGSFTMGSDWTYPEEGPASIETVEGFWLDRTEVTNAHFAAFVEATGYVTLAERGVRTSNAADAPTVRGSAVFRSRDGAPAMTSAPYWWEFVEGASWRAPEGPGSSIEGRGPYPVVHVAFEDALAYAEWHGRSLPTEEQFELAAQGDGHRDSTGVLTANTWQGSFPSRDLGLDGHRGLAPVGCYAPNAFGAYDMIGNVWEWTTTPYYARHDFPHKENHPGGFDPAQPDEPEVTVIKGGSFLCSADYCMRYRPEARLGQSKGLGASHIGFRTVLTP